MKIAIVGSREYTNKTKIKEFVLTLKKKFGERLEIISGGQPQGADGIVKKVSLEYEIQYKEFAPAHYKYNIHCALPRKFYGAAYSTGHYHIRNDHIAKYSDIVIAFIPDNTKSSGTQDTLKRAKKYGKKTIVIS
jgi:predicted Rossmann-fold nucleotide-binding protein